MQIRATPGRMVPWLEAAKADGLLVGPAGVHDNTVRVAPSLLITEAENG